MEEHVVPAKLNALKNVVQGKLKKDSKAVIFDPKFHLEVFTQYARIRNKLKSSYLNLFNNLPVRDIPKPTKSEAFEERGYITRSHLELLLEDINYCIDILSHSSKKQPYSTQMSTKQFSKETNKVSTSRSTSVKDPRYKKLYYILGTIVFLFLIVLYIPQIIAIFQENRASDKPTEIKQSIEGDENIQVIGDHTYIDNRTYIFEVGVNSKLTYFFSKVEQINESTYVKRLTIAAQGNIPVYNPGIYLKFDKVIQIVEAKFDGVLFMVKTRGSSNSSEYFFTAEEFKPGFSIEFICSNNTEFEILELMINDEKQF